MPASTTVTARWAAAPPAATAAPPQQGQGPPAPRPGKDTRRPVLPSSQPRKLAGVCSEMPSQQHLPPTPPAPGCPPPAVPNPAPRLRRSLRRARRARQPSPLPAASLMAARGGRARHPPARPLALQQNHLHTPPATTSPPLLGALLLAAHMGCFAAAAARPGLSHPRLAPSARGHFPPRSERTVTKGWNPPGGGHRQPASDNGRSQPRRWQPAARRRPRRCAPRGD